MGQTTSRLGLYLPGGGSTGTITPDEAADIDKINDNMSKIDAAAGATICTSGTRPASPYNGKLIFETDTLQVRVWNAGTSTWNAVISNASLLTSGTLAADRVAALDASKITTGKFDLGRIPVTTGSVSATTNAEGDVTITHGLGRTPAHVSVNNLPGGTIPQYRTYASFDYNSTTFRVRTYRVDTGQAFANNTVEFNWMAI